MLLKKEENQFRAKYKKMYRQQRKMDEEDQNMKTY